MKRILSIIIALTILLSVPISVKASKIHGTVLCPDIT